LAKAKGVGEEVRGRLSGHGFSTERREERRRMRSEFPRWGNERADESHTRDLFGINLAAYLAKEILKEARNVSKLMLLLALLMMFFYFLA